MSYAMKLLLTTIGILVIYSGSAEAQSSTRSLPDCYQAGVALTVSIQVNPGTGATSYTCTDQFPAGWTASNPNESGNVVADQNEVRWFFLNGQARTLTYTLTPPAGTTGTAVFSGRITVNGTPTNTGGDTSLGQCVTGRFSLMIQSNPPNDGTVSANPAPGTDGKYASGQVVTLIATAATGFHFVNWSGDATGTSTTAQVTMNTDRTVTANFAANVEEFQLDISRNPVAGGTVTANPQPNVNGRYASGQQVTLTAIPNTGFTFVQWSGAASGTSTTAQVTMTSDKSVTANFTDGESHTFPLNRDISYMNCWERRGSIRVPGATSVRLVITNADFELGYDWLLVGSWTDDEIENNGGTVYIDSAEYLFEDVTTPWISGDTLQLLMDSDSSATGSFRIQAIEYEGVATGDPVLSGALFTMAPGEESEACVYTCFEYDEQGCPRRQVCIVSGYADTLNLFKNEPSTPIDSVSVEAEGEIAGVTFPYETPAGKVWRIEPNAHFESTVRIGVPLPDGVDAENLELLYFVDDGTVRGWHVGERVNGWLASQPMVETDENGELVVEFDVNHGGVFQIIQGDEGTSGASVFGSDIRSTISSMALLVLVCLILAIWQMGGGLLRLARRR